MCSNFVTSEVAETSLLCTDEPQTLNWNMQINSDDLDKFSSLSNGASYEPSDNQLDNYSEGATIYYTPDQMPSSQESITYIGCQTDVPGTSEIAPVTESLIMHETRKLSTLKVSKGRKLDDQGEAKCNYIYSIPFYPYQTILGRRRCHSQGYKSAHPCSSKEASRNPGNFSFLWEAGHWQDKNQNRRWERQHHNTKNQGLRIITAYLTAIPLIAFKNLVFLCRPL
uniref:Uncharacterized protein n=1 Tax=Aegilops tauschii subsp. strangulata TaxID=200361 RepID=A0A453BU67_AEGTS